MELYYRSEGYSHQPTLMILHGLYGMSDNWISLAKKYAQTFFVILPDLRNHGLSPHHPVHTYEAMTEDIIQLIEKLELKTLSLMGHSMGGKVAMQVALKHPEIINKLIIADIGPGPTPGAHLHKNIGQILKSIQPAQFSSRNVLQSILKEKIGDPSIAQLMGKNIGKDKEGSLYWKPNLEAILNHLDAIVGPITLEGFFSNPTLLVQGELSNYVKEQDVELLLHHFILLRDEVVYHAGHWLHADNPAAFFQITYDFLLHA